MIASMLVSVFNPAAMLAATQLIGTSSYGADSLSPGAIKYQRFQCTFSGNCDIIKTYVTANGNVRVAIYTDSSGHPLTLLRESGSTAVTATGWKDVAITATALTSGTYYWLAIQTDAVAGGGCVYRTLGGAQFENETQAYGAFPATATPTEVDGYEWALQGWSSIDLPTVTVQPTSSVAATTATANGNITATGGENCDKKGAVYGTTSHADPGNVAPASSGYDTYAETSGGSYGTGAFTQGLTSLAVGTFYYLRTYAHNSAGYDYSATEMMFLTLPNAPSGQSATAVSNTEIDVAWTSSSVGSGSIADVQIRYSTTVYPTTLTSGTNAYSGPTSPFAHTGLTPSSYYYSLWSNAVNNNYKTQTIVATTNDIFGTGAPWQRCVFYANGLYWLFYADGVNERFKSSTDGINWSSSTVVRACAIGSIYTTACDGTNFHYVYADYPGTTVKYRMGTANSDGTITWLAAEQTVTTLASGHTSGDPSICIDTNGYPWIGFNNLNTSTLESNGWVAKSSTKDGTWTNETVLFTSPYQFSAATYNDNSGACWVSVTPLTDGKVYAIVQIDGNISVVGYEKKPKGNLWNGAAWVGEETVVNSDTVGSASISTQSLGDDVYMTYIGFTSYPTAGNIYSVKRTYGVGWGSPVLVHSMTATQAALTQDNTGILYCFWGEDPVTNHIYYKRYINGAWDTNPTDWQTAPETLGASGCYITACVSTCNNNIIVVYPTSASSPYNIRTAFLFTQYSSTYVQATATISSTIPTVTIQAASAIAATTATGNGNITDIGSNNVTDRGFYYSETNNPPTVADSVAHDTGNWGVGGAYTESLISLSPAYYYYIRAFATNSFGTGTSSVDTVLTLPTAPTWNTTTNGNQQVALDWTNATGETTPNATTIYTQVQYSTAGYPSTYSSGATGIAWTTGTSGTVTGLTNGTLYYFSLFSKAVNSGVTQYSTTYATAQGTPSSIPTVTTVATTAITTTTATGNGSYDTGGLTITRRGICWGTTNPPTTADSVAYEDGGWAINSSYSEPMTGLTPATRYYVRAYVVAGGTTYYAGAVDTILTLPEAPSGLTPTPGNNQVAFTWSNAAAGAGVTMSTQVLHKVGSYPSSYNDGTAVIGIAWTTGTNGTDSTGLSNGTLYDFAAFSRATIGGLTQYSIASVTAQATPSTVCTITTSATSSITAITANGNGNITATNGGQATERGICYSSINVTPTTADSKVAETPGPYGTGAFSETLTGLTPSTKYYARPYAINPSGTGYGTVDTFLTLPIAPTALTPTAGDTEVDFTWTDATGGAGITVTTMVRYNTTGYPTSYTDGSLGINWTTASGTVTTLTNGTLYYFSAFSKATDGGALTQYSTLYCMASATPLSFTAPTITTTPCSGFTTNSAIINGVIVAIGSAPITQYGFDYGLTTAYGTSVTTTAGITAGSTFSKTITGLSPASVYHFRAKAFNGVWGYGSDVMFSTVGSPVIYEYFNIGQDGDSAKIYSNNWAYQQFTVGTMSHTITSISLYVKKLGSPGTVTYSIKHATAGLPTGSDLYTSTFNGDTLATSYIMLPISLTSELSIEASQEYAIVIRALDGDSSNCIYWGIKSAGGIANAVYGTSSNGGSSYTSGTPADALFEVWGNPSIEITSANVFKNYEIAGDWIFIADINNVYAPYYPDKDPQIYFQLQLIDGTTIKGASACKAWGQQPLAIYLNPTTAATLTWGDAYKIRIQSLVTPGVYTDYTLTTTDWQAGGYFYLDGYIRSLASEYETYSGETYLVSIAGQASPVLNEAGSTIFLRGISDLSTVRPSLFSNLYNTGNPADTTGTIVSPNMAVALGTDLFGRVTSWGNIFDTDANTMFGWVMMLLTIVIGLTVTGTGHGYGGLVLGGLIGIGAGLVFGGIPMAVIGLVVFGVGCGILLWLGKLIFQG